MAHVCLQREKMQSDLDGFKKSASEAKGRVSELKGEEESVQAQLAEQKEKRETLQKVRVPPRIVCSCTYRESALIISGFVGRTAAH